MQAKDGSPTLWVLKNSQAGLLALLPKTVATFIWRRDGVQFTTERDADGGFTTLTVTRKGAAFHPIRVDFREYELKASAGVLARIAQRD